MFPEIIKTEDEVSI